MKQKKSFTFKLKHLNLILVVMSLSYLAYQLNHYHHENYGKLFLDVFELGNRNLLYCAVALSIVNYAIEAKKWQILLRPLQAVTWWNAFKSVLAGLTLGIFTPNRAGEVVGKLIYLDLKEKMKAALLNFSGSMAQMICTSLMGLWGLIIYTQYFGSLNWRIPATGLIFGIAVVCTMLAFLIFFNQQKFFAWLSQKKWADTIKIKFTHQQQFDSVMQLKVLLLSAIRYVVFSLQLVLLLRFCGMHAGVIQLFLLTTIFFLIIWFLPSAAILELGVRGSVALFLFGHLINNSTIALLPVTLLWLANVAIPALVGCIFLFSFNDKEI